MESQRYCRYSSNKFDNEITVIKPGNIEYDSPKYFTWEQACLYAESQYMKMLDNGISPQMARSVLPTCTKTEIVVKANFREWRHIFKLRALETYSHPDMRALILPLYKDCREICPEVFDMGEPE
jgi:thymidylate synthase (FAD)